LKDFWLNLPFNDAELKGYGSSLRSKGLISNSSPASTFLFEGGRERFINLVKAGGGKLIFVAPSNTLLPLLCLGLGNLTGQSDAAYAPPHCDVFTPLWLLHTLHLAPEKIEGLTGGGAIKPCYFARLSAPTRSLLSRYYDPWDESLTKLHTEDSLRDLLEKVAKGGEKKTPQLPRGGGRECPPLQLESAKFPCTLLQKISGSLFWGGTWLTGGPLGSVAYFPGCGGIEENPQPLKSLSQTSHSLANSLTDPSSSSSSSSFTSIPTPCLPPPSHPLLGTVPKSQCPKFLPQDPPAFLKALNMASLFRSHGGRTVEHLKAGTRVHFVFVDDSAQSDVTTAFAREAINRLPPEERPPLVRMQWVLDCVTSLSLVDLTEYRVPLQ